MTKKEIAAIDKIVENAPATKITAVKGSSYSTKDVTNILTVAVKICLAFKAATPAIQFAKKYLLIWKPSWQKAIDSGLAAVEELCSLLNHENPEK